MEDSDKLLVNLQELDQMFSFLWDSQHNEEE